MPRKLVVAVLLGLVLAPPVSARPLEIMPGVTYDHVIQFTMSGPVSMYVITAPRPGGLYSLNALLSNGTITGRETVSSMEHDVSRRMTTIGVNGDFFNWRWGWPSGLLMQSGVVEHHPAYNRAAVGIDTSGTLQIGPVPFFAFWHGSGTPSAPISQLNEPPKKNGSTLYTPIWGKRTPTIKGQLEAVVEPLGPLLPGADETGTVTKWVANASVPIPSDGAVLAVRGSSIAEVKAFAQPGTPITVHITMRPPWTSVTDAVSAGPTLVTNGQPIANAHEALTPFQLNGRAPRTAIGQRADGTIVMVAVDGRQPRWSIGITNWDLALTLIRYGCVTGFALDSGGSTTVAFDGTLLNRPSDPTGQRPVAEAFVIAYTGVYAPILTATVSANGDGYADREQLSYKLVRPSSVTAQITGPDGSTRVIDAASRAPGWHRFSWDPTGAAEGTYRWSVTATDDLGRTSTAQRSFNVDNTLGFLSVTRNARRISFTLTRDATVRVAVETTSGELLRTIAAGPETAGRTTVSWNGRDGRGKKVHGRFVVHVAATSEIGTSDVRKKGQTP